MGIKSLTAGLLLALLVPAAVLLMPGAPQQALADITCENSDYNCIYVDVTDGASGNRIVCTRAVCGSGSFGGRQYRLEGLYAFDGVNPNIPTTTAAPRPLALSVDGSSVTATGSGSCSYSGGTYLDSGFTAAWNSTSNVAVSCSWSGSFLAQNLQPGTTYYVKVTFSDDSGSVTGTSSFVAPAAETTTTIRPVTTTTVAGRPINPCLDSANPNYACGWAILGPNNQVEGVIVCTFSVCGSGTFGGMRLVLQGQQMEGGNVAGWSGGSYDEETQTFSLPGGGTLRSGDRLEDAVFPTTTTIAVDDSSPAKPIVEILADSGVIYSDSNSYVNGESEVIVTEGQVVVDLPPMTVARADYVVTFDPDGPELEKTIESGRIVDGVVEQEPLETNLSDGSVTVLGKFVASPSSANLNPLTLLRSSAGVRLVVKRGDIGAGFGVIRLRIATSTKSYSVSKIRVAPPKKYSTCRTLLRDYPGGVRAPGRVIDKKTRNPATFPVKPTVNSRVFKLNKVLDSDRDRIACEPTG